MPEGAPLTRTDTNGTNGSDVDAPSLEVVFDPQIELNRRRRSSMVAANVNHSSCFVHSLLEAQQNRRKLKACSHGTKHGTNEKMQNADLDETDIANSDAINGESDDPSSRMLTKRQLSDMAVGIRELSKHLGHLRMKLRSKGQKVLIVTKLYDEELLEHTRDVVEWILSNYKESHVYVQDILKDNEKIGIKNLQKKLPDFGERIKYWTHDFCTEHPHLFDLVITLGGDGTVLYASWLFQKVVPPILSFALGSLGFLTLFDFGDYQKILKDAFDEGVTISLRMRFECTIMRAENVCDDSKDLCSEIMEPETDTNPTHRPIAKYNVLNEIVVDRGPNPTMSSTELFGDDEHLTTIQADGICIATPTGSTAYSLAAGGSLSHPDNPVMLVSPICAHSLSFRPLILPDSMVLRVGVPYNSRTTAWASFDGKERSELKQGDYVTIAASRFPFATVRYRKHQGDFFSSLSRTLQWNSRSATQKPFDRDGKL